MTREPEDKSGGLSFATLLVSSLSAVAAAVVVPMFWARGSLIATAVTPIVVALVSEGLNRPAKVITSAAPRVARRTGTGAAVRRPHPTGVGARGEGPERVSRWSDSPTDPFGLRAADPSRRRLHVRLAVATGLLAAVIGAAVVTASELAIFGHSVGQPHRSTGLFGGTPKATATPTATATPSASATPSATQSATGTPTATPSETPTVTPLATATATATASPTETPPVP